VCALLVSHNGPISEAETAVNAIRKALPKPNGGMGSFYRSRHEFVFVLRTPGSPHINNVQLGRFGRNRSNVWDYAGANGFPRRGRQRALELHPTPKPVRMVADAILDCTNKGDLVFDPFLGGGTTLLACERVGRRCRAIELDPLYVDTAIERWQRMTGRAAKGETVAWFAPLNSTWAEVYADLCARLAPMIVANSRTLGRHPPFQRRTDRLLFAGQRDFGAWPGLSSGRHRRGRFREGR
jgi:hypothetical protein